MRQRKTKSDEPTRMTLRYPDGREADIDEGDLREFGPMLATCFAVARDLGIEAGLNMLTAAHLTGPPKGTMERAILDAAWPEARDGFVGMCRQRGYRPAGTGE